jgi:hypothetical protein
MTSEADGQRAIIEAQITISLQLGGTALEIYQELEHIQQFLIDAKTLSELTAVLNTEKNAHDIRIRFHEKD